MEPQTFYTHVSNWIKSYRNADGLVWIERFINNSSQPYAIKTKLLDEVEAKQAGLTGKPKFGMRNGANVLLDEEGSQKVYTTRFSAMCKLSQLKMAGYNVELLPGQYFYRIELLEEQPIIS